MLKLQYFGHLMQRANSLEKTLMLGKTEGRRNKRVTEDEMVGWHHRFNGHEFGQTLGGTEGQGSLVCCSLWGHKESDTTWGLSNNKIYGICLVEDLQDHPYLAQSIHSVTKYGETDTESSGFWLCKDIH